MAPLFDYKFMIPHRKTIDLSVSTTSKLSTVARARFLSHAICTDQSRFDVKDNVDT